MTRSAPLPLSPAYPNRAAWGTAGRLRTWQQQALDRYFADQPRDFLTVATPLNGLVIAWHHRSGAANGVIQADRRRACGGPPAAVATGDELTHRISTLREWAARPR